MKLTSRIALLALLGASLSLSNSQAQGRRNAGGPPHPSENQPADRSQAMAEHLATVYATIRLHDTDHDAKLNEAEQAALAKGIADGTVRPDRQGRPLPENVSAEQAARIAARMAEVYSKVTVYDTDRDGKLSDTEQASLAKAAADGKLDLPPGGPGHGRGPRGPRGDGNGPDSAEREAMHQKLLETYDTNKNGKLDEAEREVIQADVKAGKLELPGRPGRGGRGPGGGGGGPRGPRN